VKQSIPVPVKLINKQQWGHLNYFGYVHEICGEKLDQMKDIPLSGGHRVRRYKVKNSVHWLIPQGHLVDISEVPPPSGGPRRRK
jgi:hypothetical protein